MNAVKFAVPSNNELLQNYGQFYKTRAMNRLLAAVTNAWEVSGDTVRFPPLGERRWEVNNIIHRDNNFAAVPVCVRDETGQIKEVTFKVEFGDRCRWYGDLVLVAKEHENPVKFLLDHKNFWPSYEAISFLAENIGEPGVMDALEDFIVANDFNCLTSTALAKAMENALKKPELYERAREISLKHFGLGQIAAYLHDPVVKERFEKIAESDPQHHRRIFCLECLEHSEKAKSEFKKTIATRIFSEIVHANFGPSSYDNLMYMEESMWLMPESSYAALSELGGRKITERLCAKLLAEDRTLPPIDIVSPMRGHTPLSRGTCAFTEGAALYSMLKFIALKTRDQEEFNLIVKTLVEFSVTRDFNLRDLGVLEKLEDVLGDLKAYNPEMKMPYLYVKVSNNPRNLDLNPKSAIPGVFVREKEYERWWKTYNKELSKMINDPAIPEEQRIVGLRECALTIFHPGGWKHPSEHEKTSIGTDAILKLAGTPGKLGAEAARLKKWIKI